MYVNLFCREIFRDGLEQCKTSAEFLLDPWVLMQLPWHPALLMQWTAGVLTEICSLLLELTELYRWHLPLNTARVVRKLFKMVAAQMPEMAFDAIYHMQMHFYTNSQNPICERTAGFFLHKVTHKLLPLLEFITSGKARDVVRALKRLSFGTNYHSKGHHVFAKYANHEWESYYNCLFSNDFWRLGNSKELVGTLMTESKIKQAKKSIDENISLCGSEEFVMKATPKWIAEMETKYGTEIETEKVCGFSSLAILTILQLPWSNL